MFKLCNLFYVLNMDFTWNYPLFYSPSVTHILYGISCSITDFKGNHKVIVLLKIHLKILSAYFHGGKTMFPTSL